MKCPHCLTGFHADWTETVIMRGNVQLTERDSNTKWKARSCVCPECGRATIVLSGTRWVGGRGQVIALPIEEEWQVWPKGIARAPLPKEVPDKFAADYREACLVLADSPKASAALSRRCLQLLLRETAGVKLNDLSREIDEVLAAKTLPSSLAEAIDAIRNIGNFAAHPNKSTNTGEIIEVEVGEADWCLDVLESLFDFYFVQPTKLAAKKAALNQKLAEAKRPPMK